LICESTCFNTIKSYASREAAYLDGSKKLKQKFNRAMVVNSLNPLRNPNKVPSGKNVSDMCRAVKIQGFRARAHKNAYHSMRRHKLVLSGEWHDPEKLDNIRTTVAAKLKVLDPEIKHPTFGSLFFSAVFQSIILPSAI